jgi:hypothetical protein
MSFVDLFNPSFLMFLGVLVLVSALIVVYFESKMREQNHKISSMLSIVSSVAEELNNVKMTFSMNGGTINSNNSPNVIELNSSVNNNFETIRRMDLDIPVNLIEVSDDDDDDNDDEDEDEESDNESEESDDEGLDLDENAEEFDLDEDAEEFDLDNDAEIDDDAEIDVQDFDLDADAEEFDLDNNTKNDIKVLKLDTEIEPEEIDISNIDLKSIKFDTSLEEKKEPDVSEYKKLPVNKLKSIAIEKGLIDESSKLKKPEILKLLGVHINF